MKKFTLYLVSLFFVDIVVAMHTFTLPEINKEYVRISPTQQVIMNEFSFSSELPKLKEMGSDPNKMFDAVKVIIKHPLKPTESSIVASFLSRIAEAVFIPDACFELHRASALLENVKDVDTLFTNRDIAFYSIGTHLLALAYSGSEYIREIVDSDDMDSYPYKRLIPTIVGRGLPSVNCLSWAIQQALIHISEF